MLEPLDVPAVDRWLKSQIAVEGTPEVTQYPGGASNGTYRLKYPGRDLVLRRPPAGTKAKSAHDMAREYGIQRALKPSFPAAPAMVALCQDPAVIGCNFYLMERIDGLIPRGNFRTDAATARAMCLSMIDKLIELHRVDAQLLQHLSKGPGYARRQVEGWSDRYLKARTWN